MLQVSVGIRQSVMLALRKVLALFLLSFLLLSQQVVWAQSCSVPSGIHYSAGLVNPGVFHDISVNVHGVLWAVGTNGVQLITPGNQTLCALPASLAHPGGENVNLGNVATAPDNSVWAVSNSHRIYHLPAPPPTNNCAYGQWVLFPGAANDIAVSANGTVWVIGTSGADGGFGINFWSGTVNPPSGHWQLVRGGGVRITTGFGINGDSAQQPWVVNNSHQIFHRQADGS